VTVGASRSPVTLHLLLLVLLLRPLPEDLVEVGGLGGRQVAREGVGDELSGFDIPRYLFLGQDLFIK